MTVSCSLTRLVVESSFWCHTTLVTLTQTNTESSLTSAESPSDGLLWDNYKFYPKFVACPTAYRVNPQIAYDCASHITHKHALRRWITNHLMWDDIFLDKNKWGPAPFSSVRGPLTKQSKVLRGYFQSLPCAFNGSGEKVNEFSTVSHDSLYSGRIERWRVHGASPACWWRRSSRGECHCPLKVEFSMCKACVRGQSKAGWGNFIEQNFCISM